MKEQKIPQPENQFKPGEPIPENWKAKLDQIDKIDFIIRGKQITKRDSEILFDKYQRIYSNRATHE